MMRFRNVLTRAASLVMVGAAAITVGAVGAIATGCGSAADDGSSSGAAADTDVTCGNGAREIGEQCDDGNTVNNDGCNATCQFEQTTRVNSVALQWATDDFCGANAIGGAIGDQAKDTLTQALTTAVDNGTISLLFQFLHLSDLTGANDATLSLGGMVGTPVSSSGYDGSNDLDDWYTTSASSLDMNRLPVATLAGSIKKNVLSAGPGNLNMSLALGGAPVPVSLTSVHVAAQTTAASKPTASTGKEPGHLASENVDPALTSFAGLSNGGICGNITAASLAKTPVPPQLQSGSTACSQGYGASNSMLDVFVGGCNVFFFTIIAQTQPDKSTSGGAAAYTLSASNGNSVDTCTDANGNDVALKTCLAGSAYSTYLTFTADRVIAK